MRIRILTAVFGWLALTLPGIAQDDAEEQSTEEALQVPVEEGIENAGDEPAEETDVDDFIFSEEIPADTQLVFPVDI